MKNILAALFIAAMMTSCKSNSTKVEDPKTPKTVIDYLQGNWICKDLLDSVQLRKNSQSIFYNLQLPYAYELIFSNRFKDSVLVSNGFEQYYLPFTLIGDTVILQNAIQGNPLTAVYDSASQNLKIVYGKNHSYNLITSTYIQAVSGNDEPNRIVSEAFNNAFNQVTIAGKYHIVDETNMLTDKAVTFFADGKLIGLDDATLYRCCTAGDCLSMTSATINILTVLKEEKASEDLGWSFSQNGDTLKLYQLKNLTPDAIGGWKPAHLAYKLLKIK